MLVDVFSSAARPLTRRASPGRRSVMAAAAVLLATLGTSTPAAQDTAPRPGEALAGLNPQPLRVEALGLEIYPPAGALARAERIQDRIAVALVDGSEPPTWSMRIQPLLAQPGSRADPAARLDEFISAQRAAGDALRSVRKERVVLDGREGVLFYAEHGDPGPDAGVTGWLILANGARESIVFAVQTRANDFRRLAPILDASFATIRLRSPEEIARTRRVRLEAGASIISAMGPAALRSLAGRRSWHRYYRPAAATGADDDTELGWFLVEYSRAKLGSINRGRSEERYDESGHEEGLLVVVDTRHIDEASGSTYDSEARYWVAWDGSHEAWSIRGTQRWRRKARSEAQTGIRTPRSTGDPAGTLTVIEHRIDGQKRDERSWGVPEVYLSQALTWALGPLLPRTYEVPLTFSTYCLDSTGMTPSISLRVDRWEAARDGSGNWILASRPRGDAAEVVSVYGPEGTLVRRTWPDGSVADATPLDALHRLWERKGLTGPSKP